jgi:hypothetical protein
MTFTFDDGGFATSLGFDQFAVAEPTTVPGLLTVTAEPTNRTAYTMAKLITWFGFNPSPTKASGVVATAAVGAGDSTVGMPSFILNTGSLGAQ